MNRPFFILGLPRSRTYWLSKFLTYREWTCGHEELRHIRTMEDAKSWLAQPFTGSAETSLAPFWRLLPKDARLVIVRRPVSEVKDSLLRLNLGGSGAFDPIALDGLLKRLDAKLDQIEARWRGPIIEVQFAGLSSETACKAVFEHCMPYEFDAEWWQTVSQFNLQCDMRALMRHSKAFAPQMERFAKIAKQKMLSDMATHERKPLGGMVFASERFEKFYRDAQELFADHLASVGEPPDAFADKNLPMLRALDSVGALHILTARANGRMFGYLMSEVSPSRECETRKTAVHTTFYASPDAPGLGMRMEREACRMLKEKGVYDVFGRAGDRGDGPRLGAMFRRAGFERDGELYRRVL